MPDRLLPGNPGAPARRALWVLVAALVLHAVLAWLTRIPSISWGEDDAGYLLLARELRHLSYRELQDVTAPWHARFPPGFPLLLAAVGSVVGERLDALLVMQTLLSIGAVLLFFDAMRRVVDERVALVVAVLFALNPSAIHDSGHLMAEPFFKFLTMLSLWGATREAEGTRFAVVAGAAAIAAALTRSAGVVFLPALFIFWVSVRKYGRAAVFAACATATVGSWLAWTFLAPEAEHRRLYIADLGVRRNRPRFAFVADLFGRLPGRMVRLLVNVFPTQLGLPVVQGTGADNAGWVAVLIGVGGAGFLVMLRRWRVAAFYCALYLLLLLVWRYSLERFANPSIPFVYAALVLGAIWLTSRWGRRVTVVATGVLVGLLALGAGLRTANKLAKVAACDRANVLQSEGCLTPDYRVYLQVARWVRDSIPADEVFFVAKERAFFFHSGHRTINQDRGIEEDSLSLGPYLRAQGVGYAVATPVGIRSDGFGNLLATACRDFTVVRAFSRKTILLRVRGADEPRDRGTACRAMAPWRKPSGERPDRPDR